MNDDKQMDYSRMITALAMAKSECDRAVHFVQQMQKKLNEMKAEIQEFLASNPTKEVDIWYESMRQEEKEERLVRRSAPQEEEQKR